MKLNEFFQIDFARLSEALDRDDAIRKIKKLQNTAGRSDNEVDIINNIITKLSKEFNITPQEIGQREPVDPIKAKMAKAAYEKQMAANAFKNEWSRIKRSWFAEDTINELADRPYPFEYKGVMHGDEIYHFTTKKGQKYEVQIMKSGPGISVLFGVAGEILDVGITKTGDAFKVFATVIEIIKDYVNQHHPEAILFSSDRSESTRTNLYYKFAKKISQVFPDYEFGEAEAKGTTMYFRVNKKKKSISESIEPEEFRQILEKFLPFAQKIIKLDKLPTIILRKVLDDDHQPTHGRFYNEQYVLEIAIANRQPVDILRTVAHELVHAKQQREGVNIDPTTGSEEENEANAVAGIIMRHFNKAYPEYLSYQPVAEGTNNGRKRICR